MTTNGKIIINDHRSCLRAALVIGGINIMVGAAVLINTQIEEAAGKASQNFSKATGKVTATHESRGGTHDSNFVNYEFEINGQTYQCSRIGFPDRTRYTDIYKYPKGKEVTVYYDPHNPSTACLEPGIRKDNVSWNSGVGWFWVALGVLLVPGSYWFTRKNGIGYRR